MSELDLDDAIASILGDSDEEKAKIKKKSSKHKSSKRNVKSLTSSVNDDEFYKNLSKISEDVNNENEPEVKLTEEDAKVMADGLAGLDDMDSDLLGSLGRKKVLSPRNSSGGKDSDHDMKRKSSSGSLHRKGTVKPYKVKDEIGTSMDNKLMLSDEDNEDDDIFNNSANSLSSKHRKVSPNKISPRSKENITDEDSKQSKKKIAKSKEIDSDSDLPGLGPSKEVEVKIRKKTSPRSRNKRKTNNGDLFGDEDDLPDLDNPGKAKAASVLDGLMGKKTSTEPTGSKDSKPKSLDEFMAKVSTSKKTSQKSDNLNVKSPVRSPTSEETFQFGGYMPSSGSQSGRRSARSNRLESGTDFGRRSVKFSDEFGLDDDFFGLNKRPSTAPSGRKKTEESQDVLSSTLPISSNKERADGVRVVNKAEIKEDKTKEKSTVTKPTSSQGSKDSTSADWLGLGDDVTNDELNASVENASSPKPPPALALHSDEILETKATESKYEADDHTKTLKTTDNLTKSENKTLFPWENEKSSIGRRTSPNISKEDSLNDSSINVKVVDSRAAEVISGQLDTSTQQSKTLSSISPSSIETRKPQIQAEINETSSSHSLSISKAPDRISSPISPSGAPSRLIPRENAIFVSDMNRQNYENELKGMMGKIRDVENEKYKVEMELANKIAELETKIRRLEVENNGLTQCIESSKQRHEDTITAIENSHKSRVQALEESYHRREARQRDEMELMLTKHKETVVELEKEKSELLSVHAQKISSLEASKLTEIERLNETHRHALDEVRTQHLAEINHLKTMKEQEISATMTAFSHTKSLQGLMEQVLNSTKQVEDLHHLVEVSHKNSEQERDLSMRAKDEYLNQLQDRLLKQQMENDEERTRLQNLLVKMEIQLREQNRKLEEDKWKLNQEDSRLKSLRISLEEERRVTRDQLEAERGLLQRSKDEFLAQQRQMLADINEERKTLALERAEVSAAQRGIVNKEKQKHDNIIKLDAEHENIRVRLAEETAALEAREAQFKREQEEFRKEKRLFVDRQDEWSTEKDRIGKLGILLQSRAKEIEEISLEAVKARDDGRNVMERARRMQAELVKKSHELETKGLLLQEKEKHIAEERLESLKERREMETQRRSGLCEKCSQSRVISPGQIAPIRKWEPIDEHSQVLDYRPSSPFVTAEEMLTSPIPPHNVSIQGFPPDVLANALDLKRTLRRWSQDKEHDEEFLAKESEFLSSLQDSRSSPLYDM